MSNMKTKHVILDYYHVRAQEIYLEDNSVIDEDEYILTSLLNTISEVIKKDGVAHTNKIIDDDNTRVQYMRIENHDGLDIYCGLLLRLRYSQLPVVADENGLFKPLDLDDDEYLGEYNVIFYEATTNILGIQRNRNALTPMKIREFLNELNRDRTHQMYLQPIISEDRLSWMLDAAQYKSIHMNFDAEQLEGFDEGSSFWHLIRPLKSIDGLNFELKITVGRQKSKSLDNGLVRKLMMALRRSKSSKPMNKFTVGYKEHPDTRVEKFDLIEQSMRDRVPFRYSRSNKLTHEKVADKLLVRYIEFLKRMKAEDFSNEIFDSDFEEEEEVTKCEKEA